MLRPVRRLHPLRTPAVLLERQGRRRFKAPRPQQPRAAIPAQQGDSPAHKAVLRTAQLSHQGQQQQASQTCKWGSRACRAS